MRISAVSTVESRAFVLAPSHGAGSVRVSSTRPSPQRGRSSHKEIVRWCESLVCPWHEGFLKLLPAIRLHAAVSFRRLNSEARAEMVQNCVVSAMLVYARLYQLGKVDLAYAGTLARYAVAQTREGRVVGSSMNARDISSSYAQSKNASDPTTTRSLRQDRRLLARNLGARPPLRAF